MKSNQQDLTIGDRMIMVAFIGLIVFEFFVEQPISQIQQPISQINMATAIMTDFL